MVVRQALKDQHFGCARYPFANHVRAHEGKSLDRSFTDRSNEALTHAIGETTLLYGHHVWSRAKSLVLSVVMAGCIAAMLRPGRLKDGEPGR